MTKLLLLPLLFLLLILVDLSSAEITTVTITSDDRPMILFDRFGFTHSGRAAISVSSVSVASTAGPPDPSQMGFFLLSEESLIQLLAELQSNPFFCVLGSKYIIPLFTFRDLSPPPASSFNLSYPITLPNEYSLFFANCAPESTVSMDVRTELYNLYGGGVKVYLPDGSTHLPLLYFSFSFLYFAFFSFWAYYCSKASKSVQGVHFLMGLLVIAKAMNLFFAAEYNRFVKITGTPHGWDLLFYLFQFIRSVLWFTVIILIGSGWSFSNHFLRGNGKKALMVVIPLQFLANAALIVVGKNGPFIKDWVSWNQCFLLVDIVCCLAVIFPTVSSIRSMRGTSKNDGKAARNLGELALLRRFYVILIGYLIFTRIVVFALRAVARYERSWVADAAEEVVSLAFYAVVFCMFRPAAAGEVEEYLLLGEG